MRTFLHVAFCVATVACGGHKPASSPPPPPADPAPSGTMTAAECTAAGGHVVGDIGDGATSRPDYTCPDSGKPPLGHVVADPGGPQAIEGAVCCP